MPPHPNHPCNRCGGQFGDDEAMYMTAVYQPRFRNRIRTAPTCERCLDDDEREIANGQCGVGCLGCRRIMRPLVESFRRSTCGKACQARVERRRLPPKPPQPVRKCQQCKTVFRPKTAKKDTKYCSPRCRHRAKDDHRLALERAKRGRRGHPSPRLPRIAIIGA
jgi:hypothetical protein